MRQSRLLAIGLLLETHGQMSARALADHFEVSLRTIHRDIDTLAAAGVPVYAERGRTGGFRLLEGYRMQPTGLTANEAASLFLAALPGAAEDLGLGPELAAAELKLVAALPATLRPGAGMVRDRIHVDAPGWFGDDDEPSYLPQVADAVWNQRAIQVRYRRWEGEVERTLCPLGLVLKGGVWYLVANAGSQTRTYRVSRVLALTVLPESFERPSGFDLGAYWQASSAGFLQRLYTERTRIRLSPRGLRMLPYMFDRTVHDAVQASASAPDARGWVEAEMPVEAGPDAVTSLLRLGAEVEVLGPSTLRKRLREMALALWDMYGESPPRGAVDEPPQEAPMAAR
jgi:predicted DNA-binding transcriptional regulator YafY